MRKFHLRQLLNGNGRGGDARRRASRQIVHSAMAEQMTDFDGTEVGASQCGLRMLTVKTTEPQADIGDRLD